MRTRFKARELLPLTLPIAFIGGVAWWLGNGGSLLQFQGVPAGLEQGEPRLVIEKSEPLHLSPSHVSQGSVWSRKVTLWQGGKPPIGGEKPLGVSCAATADVFFRQKGVWKKAESPDGLPLVQQLFQSDSHQSFGDFVTRHISRLKVRLDTVPPDATEIRLRGFYTAGHIYNASACGSVTPSPPWTLLKSNQCSYDLKSKPFDWPIDTFIRPAPAPG